MMRSDFFIQTGAVPIVTPIVDAAIYELEDSADPQVSSGARRIREEIADSIIEVRRYGRDVDRDANLINAKKVFELGTIAGASVSDVILLAESAFFGADGILTAQVHFAKATMPALRLALAQCGYPGSIWVLTPGKIANYLKVAEQLADPSLRKD